MNNIMNNWDNKYNNLEKIDKFCKRNKLSNFIQEEIGDLNSPIVTKGI